MILLTLKSALADWTDPDVAMFALAQCIGIFGLEVEVSDVKHLIVTADTLGVGLWSILNELVEMGVLEARESDQRFRWHSQTSES